ncbi:MAG: hypothetical protein IJC68_00550 [Firmicutes bacterium]|nr:hypothetical protein [Bacillota bacterium]
MEELNTKKYDQTGPCGIYISDRIKKPLMIYGAALTAGVLVTAVLIAGCCGKKKRK